MADMIIYGSLLILFIIMIRPIALKRLPKDIFIFLWLAAIVRLLVPFNSPELINIYPAVNNSNVNNTAVIQNFLPITVTEIPEFSQSVPVVNEISNTVPEAVTASPVVISPQTTIVIIWIAGILLTFTAFIIPHIKNVKKYKSALPIENEFIANWKLRHTLIRKYNILYSDEVTIPFTYGLFKPIIVLPENILDSDNDVIDYVLTHEYTHIKCFDTLKKWFMLITLCVHWFNPLVWIMNYMITNDIEIACDEKVIKFKGIENKAYYASIIVELAAIKPKYHILTSNFNYNIIKKRVGLIMKTGKITIRQIMACLLIISFSLLINVTSYAEIANAPISLQKSSDTNAVDPYENARIEENERGYDVLLLDVEWYTYETYMEDHYYPLIEARDKGELDTESVYSYYGYGGNRIETNDPLEVAEKTALTIKYNKRIMARTINGKPAKDFGYPINSGIINNGPEVFAEQMAGSHDENGYYRFQVHYNSILTMEWYDENGKLQTSNYPLAGYELWRVEDGVNYYSINLVRDKAHYLELIETEFNPYCEKLYEDGEITKEIYESTLVEYIQSPLDYYIKLFFS